MITAYRVWDGEQMHYWDDEHLSLTIKNDGSWLLWHDSGGGCVVSSDDWDAALMWGTDQVENQVITVYEGDVIEQEETELGSPYEGVLIGSVNMLEGQWCIVNEKKKEARPVFSETAKNKILGDVFQNPELLEGAE
ncbi:YopX family protein [Bacillus halotolerans]|uniref:YopX family protein n=1 Tax=Bacillus halotolerans TaxID=260554 RepID=UPI003850751D